MPVARNLLRDAGSRGETANAIPNNRIVKPEDIGRAVIQLVSEESDYVTEITLFVDGGMTLYPGFATRE